jgi:hypothetical protein
MYEEEWDEEGKEMKRKKNIYNNKIWNYNKWKELLLGYWMYEYDEE